MLRKLVYFLYFLNISPVLVLKDHRPKLVESKLMRFSSKEPETKIMENSLIIDCNHLTTTWIQVSGGEGKW